GEPGAEVTVTSPARPWVVVVTFGFNVPVPAAVICGTLRFPSPLVNVTTYGPPTGPVTVVEPTPKTGSGTAFNASCTSDASAPFGIGAVVRGVVPFRNVKVNVSAAAPPVTVTVCTSLCRIELRVSKALRTNAADEPAGIPPAGTVVV